MSRTPRFFVSDLTSETVTLAPDEAHHLIHVLRMREGMPLTLFDGKGHARSAEVLRIASKLVTVRVLAPVESRESSLMLRVAIAVPKGDRMSWAVQKLTELGAHAIVPLVADRGEVSEKAFARSLPRLRRVVLESCKQCGRSAVPAIEEPLTLDEALKGWEGLAFLAHPGAAPLARAIERGLSVLALVGPEGGWSERELALAESKSAVRFGLGPRTLRTETAAVAAAILLQSAAGDLSTG